ncbi:hypothetical protein SKAU_G00274060 [Synaphobranchus kaupii]|uniref:Uncharacterized protein n=1 Tax=Synaphobranchus kaupii TaxID=118154 RepID=A0A9Q1F0U8_SYNKA|nr:hypothetical protein SKAU_G00274060 [Synaphobranchus kaupii]
MWPAGREFETPVLKVSLQSLVMLRIFNATQSQCHYRIPCKQYCLEVQTRCPVCVTRQRRLGLRGVIQLHLYRATRKPFNQCRGRMLRCQMEQLRAQRRRAPATRPPNPPAPRHGPCRPPPGSAAAADSNCVCWFSSFCTLLSLFLRSRTVGG